MTSHHGTEKVVRAVGVIPSLFSVGDRAGGRSGYFLKSLVLTVGFDFGHGSERVTPTGNPSPAPSAQRQRIARTARDQWREIFGAWGETWRFAFLS